MKNHIDRSTVENAQNKEKDTQNNINEIIQAVADKYKIEKENDKLEKEKVNK